MLNNNRLACLQKLKEEKRTCQPIPEKEAAQIFRSYKADINESLLEGLTVGVNVFYDNLEKLCYKWCGEDSVMGVCNGSTQVVKFLRNLDNPLVIAIVAHDTNFFIDLIRTDFELLFNFPGNYKNPECPPFYWFASACICGASGIAKFILNMYEYNCDFRDWVKKFDILISQTLASDNVELAEYVARKTIEFGRVQPPRHLDYYGLYRGDDTTKEIEAKHSKVIEAINNMFNKKKSSLSS